MNKLFTVAYLVLVFSCNSEVEPEKQCYNEYDPPRNSKNVSIEQGVWGDVWFWSGNFMPVGRGEICQIQREIYIYELTTLEDVEQIGYTPFYSKINTDLLLTTVSDDSGFFELELTPGTYSLFVKEDGKYYSNSFSSSRIFPIIIEQGEVTEVRIDITYEATF